MATSMLVRCNSEPLPSDQTEMMSRDRMTPPVRQLSSEVKVMTSLIQLRVTAQRLREQVDQAAAAVAAAQATATAAAAAVAAVNIQVAGDDAVPAPAVPAAPVLPETLPRPPRVVAPVVVPAAAVPAPAPVAKKLEECPVCREQVSPDEFELLGDESTSAEHYIKQNACYHSVCRDCCQSWVKAQLADQFYVRCPVEGCRYKLYTNEIQRLAEPADFERLMAWQVEVNLQHNTELRQLADTEEGAEIKKYLEENTKLCPHCFVTVERSEGCDFMLCVCGGNFCWLCGEDCGSTCQG